MDYIGIDLHKNSGQVCILTEDGELIERRIKTDKRDARALCEACRLGAYRPAHRTSERQRHVRAHLSVRETLVRTRSEYISLVGALARREGCRIEAGPSPSFARRVEQAGLARRRHVRGLARQHGVRPATAAAGRPGGGNITAPMNIEKLTSASSDHGRASAANGLAHRAPAKE